MDANYFNHPSYIHFATALWLCLATPRSTCEHSWNASVVYSKGYLREKGVSTPSSQCCSRNPSRLAVQQLHLKDLVQNKRSHDRFTRCFCSGALPRDVLEDVSTRTHSDMFLDFSENQIRDALCRYFAQPLLTSLGISSICLSLPCAYLSLFALFSPSP